MERLDALLRRHERGLAVIRGRRRVGKTRLLLEWGARNAGLYSVADRSSAEVQRRYLVEALSTRFPGLADASWIEKPADRSALEAMAGRLVAKGRPRIEDDAASEIVHVLFVPKVAPAA